MDPEEVEPTIAAEAEDVENIEGEGGGEGGSEAVSLSIELGDIIRIIAPTHQEIHDHIFSSIMYLPVKSNSLILNLSAIPY